MEAESRFSNGAGRRRSDSDAPKFKRAYEARYKAANPERYRELGRVRDQKWRANNVELSREQARLRAAEYRQRHRSKLRGTAEGRARDLYYNTRRRCQKKSIQFELTREWIEKRISRGLCEVTGCAFELEDGRSVFAPSLDRKIPALGYTQENTRLVVWGFNAGRGTGSDADFLKIARAMVRQADGGAA